MSDVRPEEKPEEIIARINKSLLDSDLTPNALNAMRQSTSLVLDRIQAGIDQNVREKGESVINNFCNTVGEKIGNITNSWIDVNSGGLMVIPENCRLVHKDNGFLTFIIEQRPTVRHIQFLEKHYALGFPYVQFYITFHCRKRGDVDTFEFNGMSVTCTKKSITNLNDELYGLPLSNLSGSGICLGDLVHYHLKGDTIVDKVNSLVAGYWGSQFNMDLPQNLISFLSDNFRSEFAGDRDSTKFNRGIAAWANKTKENPVFMLENNIQLRPLQVRVSRMLPQELSGANGKASVINNIREVVNQSIKSLAVQLAGDMKSMQLNDENRNQPHAASIAGTLKSLMSTGYNTMWNSIHQRHQNKVTTDLKLLSEQQAKLDNAIRNSGHILSDIENKKALLEAGKLKVTCELYQVYSHLQQELERVADLKAKLQQYVDENGDPLPARRRGRPRKEPLPVNVEQSLHRAVTIRIEGSPTPLVVGPDGQPIKRKRGRPRKNPLPESA